MGLIGQRFFYELFSHCRLTEACLFARSNPLAIQPQDIPRDTRRPAPELTFK